MELFMVGPRTRMPPLTGLGGCFAVKMEVGTVCSLEASPIRGGMCVAMRMH